MVNGFWPSSRSTPSAYAAAQPANAPRAGISGATSKIRWVVVSGVPDGTKNPRDDRRQAWPRVMSGVTPAAARSCRFRGHRAWGNSRSNPDVTDDTLGAGNLQG